MGEGVLPQICGNKLSRTVHDWLKNLKMLILSDGKLKALLIADKGVTI
jgi:hypothetical protein